MKSNRLIVIGAGSVAMALMRRIPQDFKVTCLSLDAGAAGRIEALKREGIEVVSADATSRLVLQDVGVDEADAIIITTTDERVNMEVARVLSEHFSPRRVIAVGTTAKGVEALESLGVEVENMFTDVANEIRNRIERKSKTAHAIGIGKEEILEVQVHPNSRLTNKPLRSLLPLRWRLGIIYREGNIVVPRPDTVLKARDKVIILGEPSVLKTVSEILTFNFQHFPQEYGTTAIAFLRDGEEAGFVEELKYVLSVFSLDKTVIVCPEGPEAKQECAKLEIKNAEVRQSSLSPLAAMVEAIEEMGREAGLLVLPGGLLKKDFVLKVLNVAKSPALVARGTFPYERMAISNAGLPAVEHVADTAFEIAASLNNKVAALMVRPSKYIAGKSDTDAFEESKRAVLDISLMHKAKLETLELEGNPIKAVLGAAGHYNVLLMDAASLLKGGWLASVFNPDVAWHIVRDAGVSVLLIPSVEETL